MLGTKRSLIAGALLLAGLMGTAWSINVAGDSYETIRLVVPRGDAQAGREAFLALSCHSCHAVAGDATMPVPVGANPGPTLGALQAAHATVDAGPIASAIVSPSHLIVTELEPGSRPELSAMGDLSDAMTVRQLIDLVSYVRSLGPIE